MNTVKDALLIKEHWPDTRFSSSTSTSAPLEKVSRILFQRARREGITFIRGIPGEIIEDIDTEDLRFSEKTPSSDLIIAIDGHGGPFRRHQTSQQLEVLQRLLNLSTDTDGFYMEAHPKLRPVDTTTGGVFFAGRGEGPKDIKDSVTQASAAASRANILMSKGEVKVPAITARINPDTCTACGLCAKVCPYHAIEGSKEQGFYHVIEAPCRDAGPACRNAGSGPSIKRTLLKSRSWARLTRRWRETPTTKYGLRLQLVLICRRRLCRRLANTVSSERAHYPHHVFR